jgi:hypothetical protein
MGESYFAVVRLDSFRNWTPRPENVTVRKVVERLADAESEVRYLNATAPTGTVYFIQRTSVVRENKPIAPIAVAQAAAQAAVAAVTEVVSPRSRKARAEKKARGKRKKKARR